MCYQLESTTSGSLDTSGPISLQTAAGSLVGPRETHCICGMGGQCQERLAEPCVSGRGGGSQHTAGTGSTAHHGQAEAAYLWGSPNAFHQYGLPPSRPPPAESKGGVSARLWHTWSVNLKFGHDQRHVPPVSSSTNICQKTGPSPASEMR